MNFLLKNVLSKLYTQYEDENDLFKKGQIIIIKGRYLY